MDTEGYAAEPKQGGALVLRVAGGALEIQRVTTGCPIMAPISGGQAPALRTSGRSEKIGKLTPCLVFPIPI